MTEYVHATKQATEGGHKVTSILLPGGGPTMAEMYAGNCATPGTGVCVLMIDPQCDFHPESAHQPFNGSLAVSGADKDAERIAAMIEANGEKIDAVFITLDTHQRYHIAHGMFWKNAAGESPPPFTIIANADVAGGKWAPVDEKFKDHCLHYTKTLEEKGKFQLCIWPEHCLVGTQGHAVESCVAKAVHEWEMKKTSAARFFCKGNNSLTEHYSCIEAEVVIEADPHTQANRVLVDDLKTYSKVIVCGQAKSHCVNYTVRDLLRFWPKEETSRLVILEDGMSSVTGFEESGTKFIEDMKESGLTMATCDNPGF